MTDSAKRALDVNGAALYDIELFDEAWQGWRTHLGGTLLYCAGWLDCLRETAPTSRARVIRRWDGAVVGQHPQESP